MKQMLVLGKIVLLIVGFLIITGPRIDSYVSSRLYSFQETYSSLKDVFLHLFGTAVIVFGTLGTFSIGAVLNRWLWPQFQSRLVNVVVGVLACMITSHIFYAIITTIMTLPWVTMFTTQRDWMYIVVYHVNLWMTLINVWLIAGYVGYPVITHWFARPKR